MDHIIVRARLVKIKNLTYLFFIFFKPSSPEFSTDAPRIYLLGKVNPVAVVHVCKAKYSFSNPLDGIDCCFKAYWALNCRYPAKSAHVWQLLQKVIYNIASSADKIPPSVQTLFNDIKQVKL